ncbi:hypothetical protein JCM8097_006205 [Rhodosporidiobolus ruineniae]
MPQIKRERAPSPAVKVEELVETAAGAPLLVPKEENALEVPKEEEEADASTMKEEVLAARAGSSSSSSRTKRIKEEEGKAAKLEALEAELARLQQAEAIILKKKREETRRRKAALGPASEPIGDTVWHANLWRPMLGLKRRDADINEDDDGNEFDEGFFDQIYALSKEEPGHFLNELASVIKRFVELRTLIIDLGTGSGDLTKVWAAIRNLEHLTHVYLNPTVDKSVPFPFLINRKTQFPALRRLEFGDSDPDREDYRNYYWAPPQPPKDLEKLRKQCKDRHIKLIVHEPDGWSQPEGVAESEEESQSE